MILYFMLCCSVVFAQEKINKGGISECKVVKQFQNVLLRKFEVTTTPL